MDIPKLADLAIDKINSMSVDELELKFIEHGNGYIPTRRKKIENKQPTVFYNEKIIM